MDEDEDSADVSDELPLDSTISSSESSPGNPPSIYEYLI